MSAVEGEMQPYRNLIVWQKAHGLTLDIYHERMTFPREEIHGITNQMRRASSSIAANIAEGCGGGSDGELRQRLQIAMGSATELDSFLLLARDLGMLSEHGYERLPAAVTEVRKVLSSFIVRLRGAPLTANG